MHRLSQVKGFVRREATADEIRGSLAFARPEAPVRLGLLSNPMASTNWRSVGHQRLCPLLSDPLAAVSTPSVGDLAWALGYLLYQRGVNVLAVNGGDGTIHHAVDAALHVVDDAARRIGEPVPLPTFLFLNGGGMNMLARAFDTRGHPVRTVRRFLDVAETASLGDVPMREVPLLAVEEPGGTHRHGFIFGSEVVLNALTMYERFGQGYRGLTRFLYEVAAGYAFDTESWRRHGHLLDPPGTPLAVDGVEVERYTAAVLSTIPMTLLRGAVAAIRDEAPPGTMSGLVVEETDPGRVLALIPGLMRAKEARGVRRLRGVREVSLQGPYTLDGELVQRFGDLPPREAPIRVRGTDRLVRAVALRP